MNWISVIAETAAEAGIPAYSRMPTFGKGGQPELFAVVTGYDNPAARADGKLIAREYHLTMALFSESQAELDEALELMIPALEAQGIRYSGCRYSEDEDFPQRYRRDAEFVV